MPWEGLPLWILWIEALRIRRDSRREAGATEEGGGMKGSTNRGAWRCTAARCVCGRCGTRPLWKPKTQGEHLGEGVGGDRLSEIPRDGEKPKAGGDR
jgi:hypothetical protein